MEQDIWITASHVPRVKNTNADLIRSRLFYDNKEWSLNERIAKPAQALFFDQFGKTEIELFASRLNSKCLKYASYTNLTQMHIM